MYIFICLCLWSLSLQPVGSFGSLILHIFVLFLYCIWAVLSFTSFLPLYVNQLFYIFIIFQSFLINHFVSAFSVYMCATFEHGLNSQKVGTPTPTCIHLQTAAFTDKAFMTCSWAHAVISLIWSCVSQSGEPRSILESITCDQSNRCFWRISQLQYYHVM